MRKYLWLLGLLILSCKETGITEISFGVPKIEGVVLKYIVDQNQECEATVEIWGTELVPVVTVNKDTLNLIDSKIEDGFTYYTKWCKKVGLADTYSLKVTYGKEASAVVAMPEEYKILSPLSDETLRKNEDLVITWNKSKGADYYELEVKINYNYQVGFGPTRKGEFDTSLVLKDTTITFSSDVVFKDVLEDTGTLKGGEGKVTLRAVTGPYLGHTVEGNIEGEGQGYFWCKYQKEVDFKIESEQ